MAMQGTAAGDKTVTNTLARALVAALIAGQVSCSGGAPSRDDPAVARQPLTVPAVRFSEVHYDNSGTDLGEPVKLSRPAGTDLTGWQVALYNRTGRPPV